MQVSCDEYELPEITADSWGELAEKCGTSENNIHSRRWHYFKGKTKHMEYLQMIMISAADVQEEVVKCALYALIMIGLLQLKRRNFLI